ncbi:ribonuclease P protein component [Labilibaculum sp. DW002]|uniref:Ribonuclease P protein component n=1 Tax=Paralabilibaculum antarcticum TaxID=2912572 RepID=A0ABT5VZW5_9BACT|nr:MULTISPECIES: ribonuclease P protein component [unclassified Labilibaculum]MBI9056680.1 ribonuclease P protein component [Labilibaculum sp.]MDE5419864.1 ribonuclease P protein component [Labilibaculum sp. DW002]
MVETNRFTFKKAERLTHKILIGKLFSEGKGFICYPFRIVWKEAKLNSEYPAQVAITVAKRNFKKAVTRNLLKRRIRELYRLNKGEFYEELERKGANIAFMVVYLPKTVLKTSEMEAKFKKALKRIPKEYEMHSQPSDKGDSIHHDTAN